MVFARWRILAQSTRLLHISLVSGCTVCHITTRLISSVRLHLSTTYMSSDVSVTAVIAIIIIIIIIIVIILQQDCLRNILNAHR